MKGLKKTASLLKVIPFSKVMYILYDTEKDMVYGLIEESETLVLPIDKKKL